MMLGTGGRFASQRFHLDRDGHGSLQADGAVVLETRHGTVHGGPGQVDW